MNQTDTLKTERNLTRGVEHAKKSKKEKNRMKQWGGGKTQKRAKKKTSSREK